MNDMTVLDALLGGTEQAGASLNRMDEMPVTATQQRYSQLDVVYSQLGDSDAANAIAIGKHNADVAQSLADAGAEQASRSAFQAVQLADQLNTATEQVNVLRTTAETANKQLQPLLEQRNTLAANFPGWGNPLARVSAAYKVAQLDERIAGLQQNAAAAVDSANSLASTQSATIKEYAQADQLRISADYNERVALTKQQYAGNAEQLNAMERANAALTAEANQRFQLTTTANNERMQQEDLTLRKNAADRQAAALKEEKRQVDVLARQVLRTRGVVNPSIAQLDGARVFVREISPESRSHLARLVTVPGAQVNDQRFVLNSLANSGASLEAMRQIGGVLDLPELRNLGTPLYESAYQSSLTDIKRTAYFSASEAVKEKPGVRKVGGLPVTEAQWWESLKPTERAAYEKQAKDSATLAMQTNTIAGLNASVYSKIGPSSSFSITTNTPEQVQRTFGIAANSPEAKVLLDPSARVRFDAAAKRDGNNAGPLQFLELYDSFQRAGSKDPAGAVAKVVAGFARGAAATTADGSWLRNIGIDLPALYVVRDANGNPRNLANPQEFEKFRTLTQRAQKQQQAKADGILSMQSFQKFGEDMAQADAAAHKEAEGWPFRTGGSTGNGQAGAKQPTKQQAKSVSAAPDKLVQQLTQFATGGGLSGTDLVPAVNLDVSGERSAEALRGKNTPDAVAERGKQYEPQGAPGESYGLRKVLEERARENALRIQQLKEADARAQQAQADSGTPSTGSAIRDFIRGDPAAREERLAAKGGGNGPAATASMVGPSLADDIAAKVVQVQRAETSAAKEQSFLQLVRELYARAFGGGEGAYIPQTPSAQQQAEAAAEYERNGGR